MLKHIVMYKLLDGSEDNKTALVEKFLSMKGKIPELLSIESGKDVLFSERSFDVVLICEFESVETLKIYKEHPVHIPVMQYVKSVVSQSKSVDYIY